MATASGSVKGLTRLILAVVLLAVLPLAPAKPTPASTAAPPTASAAPPRRAWFNVIGFHKGQSPAEPTSPSSSVVTAPTPLADATAAARTTSSSPPATHASPVEDAKEKPKVTSYLVLALQKLGFKFKSLPTDDEPASLIGVGVPEEALELGKNAHKAEESRAAPTDDFPPLNTARIASTASDKTAPPPARAFPNVRDPPAEEEASASTSDSAAPDRASPLSTGFQKVIRFFAISKAKVVDSSSPSSCSSTSPSSPSTAASSTSNDDAERAATTSTSSDKKAEAATRRPRTQLGKDLDEIRQLFKTIKAKLSFFESSTKSSATTPSASEPEAEEDEESTTSSPPTEPGLLTRMWRAYVEGYRQNNIKSLVRDSLERANEVADMVKNLNDRVTEAVEKLEVMDRNIEDYASVLLVAIALVMILGILLFHQVRVNGLVLRDAQQRLSMAETTNAQGFRTIKDLLLPCADPDKERQRVLMLLDAVDDSDVADQVKRERDEMLFYNLYYRRFSEVAWTSRKSQAAGATGCYGPFAPDCLCARHAMASPASTASSSPGTQGSPAHGPVDDDDDEDDVEGMERRANTASPMHSTTTTKAAAPCHVASPRTVSPTTATPSAFPSPSRWPGGKLLRGLTGGCVTLKAGQGVDPASSTASSSAATASASSKDLKSKGPMPSDTTGREVEENDSWMDSPHKDVEKGKGKQSKAKHGKKKKSSKGH